MAKELQLAGSRFNIREATKADIPAITDVFFHSFNSPFFRYLTPPNDTLRKWWHESHAISLDSSADRTFVAEDTEMGNRIVAFSRWMTPQADGNLERKWPDLDPKDWDLDLCGAFFGGMEENREALMGKRPHWMLELLGVHEDYQRLGIGARLLKYGTDQADEAGLETYLDASEAGGPYYVKWHVFVARKAVELPDRPEYGHFDYISMVRPPQKAT